MVESFFDLSFTFLGDRSLLEVIPRSLIYYMIMTCCSIPLLHVVIIRITKSYGESARPLLFSCAVSLLCWIGMLFYMLTFTQLEISTNFIASCATSLFIYFGFVLGYLEFFSLINRGYSLSIMMDISRRTIPPSISELENEYADGRGLRWMLTKRVKGLSALKLVTENNKQIVLNKGWSTYVARILYKAKILFSIKGSG